MEPSAEDTYNRLMVLKYLISHAYRNMGGQYLKQGGNDWTTAEKDRLEEELENDKHEIVLSMKSFGVWDYATASEKDFVATSGSKMSHNAQLNAIWRMEAAAVLMWSLNLFDKFPGIDEQTDPALLKMVDIKKSGLLPNGYSLRPYDQISKMRDVMELWHWRVNTRRLIENNYDFQPDGKSKQSGVVNLDDIVIMTAKSAFSKGDVVEVIEGDFVFRGRPFRDLAISEFHEATSIIIERHYALNWLCGYAPKNNWDETPTDT